MNRTLFLIISISVLILSVSAYHSFQPHFLSRKIRTSIARKSRGIQLHDSITSTLGIDPETVQALSELQGTVSSGSTSGNIIVGKSCRNLMTASDL